MLYTSGEYQIPPGEVNPAPSSPIYDELASAYQNTTPVRPDSPLYYQEHAKQILMAEENLLNCELIKGRAGDIEAARKYAIDSTLFVYGKSGHAGRIGKVLRTLVGGDIDRLLPLASPKDLTHRELIQRESLIGAEIFGTPPEGGQRTFFYSDAQEWVWHEASFQESMTTRYIVQEKGILKIQDGAPQYEYIEGEELKRLVRATEIYHNHVMSRLYKPTDQIDYTLAA